MSFFVKKRQISQGSFLKSVKNLKVPDCRFLGMKNILVFFLKNVKKDLKELRGSLVSFFQECQKSRHFVVPFFKECQEFQGPALSFFFRNEKDSMGPLGVFF